MLQKEKTIKIRFYCTSNLAKSSPVRYCILTTWSNHLFIRLYVLLFLGDKPNLYGNQRLWGSVGWGLFSIVAGFMVDNFSESDTNKNYTSVFYLMLGMMVLDLIVAFRLKVSFLKYLLLIFLVIW